MSDAKVNKLIGAATDGKGSTLDFLSDIIAKKDIPDSFNNFSALAAQFVFEDQVKYDDKLAVHLFVAVFDAFCPENLSKGFVGKFQIRQELRVVAVDYGACIRTIMVEIPILHNYKAPAVKKTGQNNVHIFAHGYICITKAEVIKNELSGDELHTAGHGDGSCLFAKEPSSDGG